MSYCMAGTAAHTLGAHGEVVSFELHRLQEMKRIQGDVNIFKNTLIGELLFSIKVSPTY